MVSYGVIHKPCGLDRLSILLNTVRNCVVILFISNITQFRVVMWTPPPSTSMTQGGFPIKIETQVS